MLPVLIVDDDPAIRKLLQLICRRYGLTAEIAAGGAAAMEMIQSAEYAAVVIDLMMPAISGFEVIQRLRETQRHPTVVVVTAMSDAHIEALDLGVVHSVIRKPFDVAAVGKLLVDVAGGVQQAV